jgi:hypothetical protein
MTRLTFDAGAAGPGRNVAPGTIQVTLFGSGLPAHGRGTIGNPLPDAVARLGVPVDSRAFDFLAVALAVTAADTFVERRAEGGNGWARSLELDIPVANPVIWQDLKTELEHTLRFLSGDDWSLMFRPGGAAPPSREAIAKKRKLLQLSGVDCACLFSGGLDSMVGVQALVGNGKKPVLVSHAYRGDRSHQRRVYERLGLSLPRFSANASPIFGGPHQNDTTMRTRSLNFLAYGAVALSAVAAHRSATAPLTLFVPENGFIALNAPLTRRRVGTHSTRTTHPHFLRGVQRIFDRVGIPVALENPYRHATKGEMLQRLDAASQSVSMETVSCGRWKRKNMQCGHCVPCLIRRAAFHSAGMQDTTEYQEASLPLVWNKPDRRDDLMAMVRASLPSTPARLRHRAVASGPLPLDGAERQGWFDVHERGLAEVRDYLTSEGL